MINKISILGLGLIGGSIAKALGKLHPRARLCGYARSTDIQHLAIKTKVVSEATTSLECAVEDADIIIIATPPSTIVQILSDIKPFLKEQTIITDVLSTKGNVVDALGQVFSSIPQNFVPGHPIAGKEKNGLEASDEKLFKGAKVVLTPLAETRQDAIKIVQSMWEGVGANVTFLDASSHDQILALASHLPHLLAFAFMSQISQNEKDLYNYLAGGFKDFSRIASSDATMWADIFLVNKEDILARIEEFKTSLDVIEQLIQNGEYQALKDILKSAKVSRDEWLAQTATT